MRVNGVEFRTVWMEGTTVKMIEQNLLPFEFKIFDSKDYLQTCMAIKTMIVRGAGAIGATAAFGMAQAALMSPISDYQNFIHKASLDLAATRPTAQNLFYAVDRVYAKAKISPEEAVIEAQAVADEDADCSRKIGEFGAKLIKDGFNVLTHCNAGWLAFVDYGTALSPIYTATKQGKKVFVYADETRPRSQGARLTAWELKNENVPHAILPDNAAAYMMQQGKINLAIVGADRIAKNGDTANKIGTLEKAICAKYYGIPFYIAAPTSTFDIHCISGNNIPIEERSQDEVLYQTGPKKNGEMETILVCSPGSSACNPAFDVTPAELITGIITEKGIIKPNEVEKCYFSR